MYDVVRYRDVVFMAAIEVVFSPTGGTRKVADAVMDGVSKDRIYIDLSEPGFKGTDVQIGDGDIVVIAVPSFGGRAAPLAMQRLKLLKGNGARCVLVCAYGNRAYEDSMVEMQDVATSIGLKVISTIAAVTSNSIVPEYGAGRPSKKDLEELTRFGTEVASKDTPVSSVPGNRLYKKELGTKLAPQPTSACNKCGKCAASCPTNAIDTVTFKANKSACVSCMRCIRDCDQDARKLNGVIVSLLKMMIGKQCTSPKENELHL